MSVTVISLVCNGDNRTVTGTARCRVVRGVRTCACQMSHGCNQPARSSSAIFARTSSMSMRCACRADPPAPPRAAHRAPARRRRSSRRCRPAPGRGRAPGRPHPRASADDKPAVSPVRATRELVAPPTRCARRPYGRRLQRSDPLTTRYARTPESAPRLWCGSGFDNLILPGQRERFDHLDTRSP